MESIKKIHHISATVGDPNENLHFYRDVLNLKLIKKTVNFENKYAYHLYFSNKNVDAGSIITFFPRVDDLYGKVGGGQVRQIGFAVPKNSLESWKNQLNEHHIHFTESSLNGNDALFFHDPHSLSMALVESSTSAGSKDILGFYGVELLSSYPAETVRLLIHQMGLVLKKISEDYYHLETIGEEKHQILLGRKTHKKGQLGIGTVHHIAWSVSDKEELLNWKELLEEKKKCD